MDHGILLQWLDGSFDDKSELQVNSGVFGEASEQAGGARYVPRQDWRAPTASERAALLACGEATLAETVSVFQVDPRVRASFWSEHAATICSPDPSIDAAARKAALWACAEETLKAVAPLGIKAEALRSCDIQITPAGSASTAFDHFSGAYIGLHIDNHDKLPLSKRSEAFQLLCLNLGEAERYFLFVNLRSADLVAQTGTSPDDAEEKYRQAWRLTADFFQRRPDYPVVRVMLPPDHGYIAVTQSLIHDGATNLTGKPDVALLLAGRFNAPSAHFRPRNAG